MICYVAHFCCTLCLWIKLPVFTAYCCCVIHDLPIVLDNLSLSECSLHLRERQNEKQKEEWRKKHPSGENNRNKMNLCSLQWFELHRLHRFHVMVTWGQPETAPIKLGSNRTVLSCPMTASCLPAVPADPPRSASLCTVIVFRTGAFQNMLDTRKKPERISRIVFWLHYPWGRATQESGYSFERSHWMFIASFPTRKHVRRCAWTQKSDVEADLLNLLVYDVWVLCPRPDCNMASQASDSTQWQCFLAIVLYHC